MVASGFVTPLQLLIVLMLHLDILLSPLMWLTNWQGYLSGSTFRRSPHPGADKFFGPSPD